MENFYFFLNDRILLIFNVLLTLGHTWQFFKGKDLTSLCYLNLNQVIIRKKSLTKTPIIASPFFFAEYLCMMLINHYFSCFIYIYIYIYITEASEAPTIFQVTTIFFFFLI